MVNQIDYHLILKEKTGEEMAIYSRFWHVLIQCGSKFWGKNENRMPLNRGKNIVIANQSFYFCLSLKASFLGVGEKFIIWNVRFLKFCIDDIFLH